MIRTYCFPGVLRGRPGPRLATTPTNRPRRSLSSPGMLYGTILAAGRAEIRAAPAPVQASQSALDRARSEGRRGARPDGTKKTTRPRVAVRNLLGRARRATSLVARPHTSVASLFASRFRVWIQGTSEAEPMQ